MNRGSVGFLFPVEDTDHPHHGHIHRAGLPDSFFVGLLLDNRPVFLVILRVQFPAEPVCFPLELEDGLIILLILRDKFL